MGGRPRKTTLRDPEGTQKEARKRTRGAELVKKETLGGGQATGGKWRGTGPREVCRDRRGDEDRTEPGDLEKPGESQGGEGSLKDEEGKWTSEADPEAEADERKPGGGNRREARARHP